MVQVEGGTGIQHLMPVFSISSWLMATGGLQQRMMLLQQSASISITTMPSSGIIPPVTKEMGHRFVV